MKVRDYAKSVGFEVVGKLTRHPELERYGIGSRHERVYVDEAGNEYYMGKHDGCIATHDGKVI